MLTKLMLLFFSRENLSPFLQLGTIADSYQFLGISYLAQNDPTSFDNSDVVGLPPLLKKDGDVQLPCASLQNRSL